MKIREKRWVKIKNLQIENFSLEKVPRFFLSSGKNSKSCFAVKSLLKNILTFIHSTKRKKI